MWRKSLKNKKEINLGNFWHQHEYFTENYVEKTLTDEMVSTTESKLGYRLPESYIELMKIQNGGKPIKNYWINEYAKGNEVEEIGITGFFGIGSKKRIKENRCNSYGRTNNKCYGTNG